MSRARRVASLGPPDSSSNASRAAISNLQASVGLAPGVTSGYARCRSPWIRSAMIFENVLGGMVSGMVAFRRL